MSIFWTFLKLHYSGLKSILSYPDYLKTIFSGLIFTKNTHEKIFNFWIKSIIYLGNFDFLDSFKNSLFWSKKHSFLSRISQNHLILLNLPNKYLWENIRFFHRNHGLTPLEIFDFSDFSKTSLLMSKQHSYLSKISKNRLFLLNLPNKYLWENIRFFHKNHKLTPLENFDFLGFFKTSFLV